MVNLIQLKNNNFILDSDENNKINYNVDKLICHYCGFYDKDLKSRIKEHINEWCPWVIIF